MPFLLLQLMLLLFRHRRCSRQQRKQQQPYQQLQELQQHQLVAVTMAAAPRSPSHILTCSNGGGGSCCCCRHSHCNSHMGIRRKPAQQHPAAVHTTKSCDEKTACLWRYACAGMPAQAYLHMRACVGVSVRVQQRWQQLLLPLPLQPLRHPPGHTTKKRRPCDEIERRKKRRPCDEIERRNF